MKETLKRNWKGITATVVAFGAVFGAIYYVNHIYLPDKRQAAAEQLAAQDAAEVVTPKEYNFDINETQPTALSSGNGTNTADDNIKVTTDADGNVTIDRKWDHVDLDELDTSTAAPGAPTANIGSGGGKITGTDGAYHGEQPTTTAPSTGGSSGTTTTKPSTGDSTSKPSTDTEKKPSTGTTTKPTTPSTSGSTTEKPSGGSNSGSSTPKDGDIRTENGKQQEYVDGFGWVDITNNIGGTDYIEMGPDTGEICENASFG